MDKVAPKTYRTSRTCQLGYGLGAIALFGFLVVFVVVIHRNWDDPQTGLRLGVAGFLLLMDFCLAWMAIYTRGARVRTGEDGVSATSPFRQPASLAWHEVKYLCERRFPSRLELQDHDRGTVVQLTIHLEGFAGLHEFILRRVRLNDAYDPAGMGFVSRNQHGELVVESGSHRDPVKWVIAVIMLLVAVFVPWREAIFIDVVLGWCLMALAGWDCMTVTSTEIRLRYLFRTRRIRLERIQDVVLEGPRVGGASLPDVQLIRDGKDRIIIRHNRIGAIGLYNIIYDAWRQPRSRSHST